MKTVNAVAHSFDCLPGHVLVSGRGTGANVRVATIRAVGQVFLDPRLRRKQIGDFRMSVVVISDRQVGEEKRRSRLNASTLEGKARP